MIWIQIREFEIRAFFDIEIVLNEISRFRDLNLDFFNMPKIE